MNIKRIFSVLAINYADKQWWKRHIILRTSKWLYKHAEGFNVLSENWDHLIILDACRFDVFAEEIAKTQIYTRGKLEYRISSGSMTKEFLVNNFGTSKLKFDDIVYITANPFVDMLLKGKFYKIIPVWKDGWDYKRNTVLPKTMYEYTKRAIAQYPNKRLIVHFMQPHFPFLTLKLPGETGFAKHREAALQGVADWKDKTIWDLVENGRIPLDLVRKAYRENLKISLKYVEKIVRILGGRIVITSDHGEAFGEYLHRLIPLKVYGHPQNVRIEALVKVPWFVIEKPKRSPKNTSEKHRENYKLAVAIKKFVRERSSNYY